MDMDLIVATLRKFRDERDWARHHTLRNLSMALSVEASELLRLLQWEPDDAISDWLNDNDNRKKVENEIADVFIYLTYLVDYLNIDLERSVITKIHQNSKRAVEGACLAAPQEDGRAYK